MKKILITGGSGFVGKYLATRFLSENYAVTGLGTSSHHPLELESGQEFENFKWISADTTREGVWQNHVATADVVINLAGRNIFKPWTKKYKQAIYDFRILTTKHLVAAMGKGAPVKLLNASAVDIYGDCGGRQWFSWIHIHDVYRAIKLLMDTADLEGTFNFTGPELVR